MRSLEDRSTGSTAEPWRRRERTGLPLSIHFQGGFLVALTDTQKLAIVDRLGIASAHIKRIRGNSEEEFELDAIAFQQELKELRALRGLTAGGEQ